ncbi:MAG TPA: GNAT family N-acetyltransferase [Burkholderiales bacterium]|nr:GNAT family N-acetyltransferase [Burkholderiales bacterium]
MPVATTARLTLREIVAGDAPFILTLVNDPAWLRFIGDKNVHTESDARRYIEAGPAAMYAQRGFGLWLAERSDDGVPIGMCGLIKRDTLPDVDLGFAFLPAYRGNGYAFEAAQAAIDFAWERLGLARVVAITAPDNDDSVRLLERLGFRFERMLQLADDAPAVRLYAAQRERRVARPG